MAAAAHRAGAFAACRQIIEALKADVPIWKREVYDDGSAPDYSAARAVLRARVRGPEDCDDAD